MCDECDGEAAKGCGDSVENIVVPLEFIGDGTKMITSVWLGKDDAVDLQGFQGSAIGN